MRIALISLAETTLDEDSVLRGSLSFVGRSLAQRQVETALGLGCERVICLSKGLPAGHLDLQRTCENAGVHFNLVESAMHLSGLVRSADDLFVFAEGVLLDSDDALARLADRRGILVADADKAVPAGFERIDASQAWAGLLRTGGDAVERLSELPPDIEPASALLRISLQAGMQAVPLNDGLLADGALAAFETTAQVKQSERNWIQRNLPMRSWFSPGLAASDRVLQRLAPKMLELELQRGTGLAIIVAMLLIAMLADWYAGDVAGYAMLALAAAAQSEIAGIAGLGQNKLALKRFGIGRSTGMMLDLTIIALAMLPQIELFDFNRLFAIAVMVSLLRIAADRKDHAWAGVFGDRLTLCAILAVGAAFSLLIPTAQGIAVMVLAYLVVSAKFTQLTRA